jgi:hypothetical protein
VTSSNLRISDLTPEVAQTTLEDANTTAWLRQWTVGHTIRPNGELLEGNPPEPVEHFPVTRENYRTWYAEALGRALRHLGITRDGRCDGTLVDVPFDSGRLR